MMLEIAKTPEGIVIRVTAPWGEIAWRKNHNGSVDRCNDRKGPWVGTVWELVPSNIIAGFDLVEAGAK